jgi:hypothetical protein
MDSTNIITSTKAVGLRNATNKANVRINMDQQSTSTHFAELELELQVVD